MRNFEPEDNDPLKVWIRESGAVSPKAGFHLNILKKISSQPTLKPYEPVISVFGLKILGGIIAVFVLAVLLFVPASEASLSYWDQLPDFTIPNSKLVLSVLVFPIIELGAIFKISIIIFSFMAFCVSIMASKKLRYQ